jgi:hypothetical protein
MMLVAVGALAALAGQEVSTATQAVFDAIRAGDREGLARLVAGHPEYLRARDRDGQTPLHAAVVAQKADLVAWLLEGGAPVNEPDADGNAPVLAVALTSGSVDLVKLLAAKGADLGAKDKWGATVMDLAEAYRRHEMMRYLLERALASNARPPAPRRDRSTWLHLAARCGSVEAIDALVRAGLAVNGATTSGWTPLHFAAEQGHARAVERLLDSHAPINARAADGSTAYHLAAGMGHADVTALLAGKGADTGAPTFPALTGPYFGQTPPRQIAAPIAEGSVASRYRHHGTVVFSPDGREAYWAVLDYGKERRRVILESRIENGTWTPPRLASFSRVGAYDDVPFVSPDGKRLFFISARSLTPGGKPDKERIWVMERGATGWQEPQPLPPVINELEGIHHQMSSDERGNLYFAAEPKGGHGSLDIYCAPMKDGVYQAPVNLGPVINGPDGDATPFIAPDGSYLLFTRFSDTGWTLFASTRTKDGEWTPPTNLASAIDYPGKRNMECPVVTRDGKYLFFTADVENLSWPYWVEASFIERLRRKR